MASFSPFSIQVETIGSHLDRVFCPHCQSQDRERHLRLYFERLGIPGTLDGATVLHMAPEGHLIPLIRSSGAGRYVCGDLSPRDASVERIDLLDIPYPDGAFGLAIANHMLEHVADFRRALSELHRVLAPGGRLICQTPFAARLTATIEDPLLSPEDRMFFYCHENHVRLFGADIADHFIAAGFIGRLRPHSQVLPDIDGEEYGINEREPFFDFVKPPS